MASLAYSGTQTCTVGTTHDLQTITTAGVYLAEIDLTNAADGDVFQLWATNKILSSGSEIASLPATIGIIVGTYKRYQYAVQVITNSCTIKLKQTQGTSKNIDWAIRRVDA